MFETEHLQGNGRKKLLMETISRNKGRKSVSSLRPESRPLTSRNQKILIVGIKSSIFVVTSDVSQGLLLEPLSFLISIR